MKRIIPLLMLTFAFAACQDEGPTQPGDSPLFGKAKDCDDPKWQDHPSCDGGNGDGDGAYTAIPLGEARVASKARDLTSDGALIVGWSEDAGGDPVAAVWTYDETGMGGPFQLHSTSTISAAIGINDAGNIIVGGGGTGVWRGHWEGVVPVMWKPSDDGWGDYELDPNDPADPGGWAVDVNASGVIAGHSGRTATLWNPDGTVYMTLPSYETGGHSEALAINSDGYVVGRGYPVSMFFAEWHAMLWRPDSSYCDLHVAVGWGEDGTSKALGVSDVTADGTVFVAGAGADAAVIWKMDPDACQPIVLHESPSAEAHDVSMSGEAVGVSGTNRRPTHWDAAGNATLLADSEGYAFRINAAGSIVGFIKAKGTEQAMLWIPTEQ
jgi:uncharacterized membrane protein